MTVKTDQHQLIQCTPAVRIILDKPILLNSLESNTVFPTEVEILYESYRIPIEVGAVLAPIPQNVFVSPETPYPVGEVYAIPVKPLVIDYVNHDKDVIVSDDTQAVIVDGNEQQELPPRNVTVLDFPEVESEPQFHVDEEDQELGKKGHSILVE